VAVVGRPNAGKSSLVNAILRDKRTIVSDVAGTTRDAIDVPYLHDGQPYVLIDTAGMRPRSRRDTSVEVFSAMRSEKTPSAGRTSACWSLTLRQASRSRTAVSPASLRRKGNPASSS